MFLNYKFKMKLLTIKDLNEYDVKVVIKDEHFILNHIKGFNCSLCKPGSKMGLAINLDVFINNKWTSNIQDISNLPSDIKFGTKGNLIFKIEKTQQELRDEFDYKGPYLLDGQGYVKVNLK